MAERWRCPCRSFCVVSLTSPSISKKPWPSVPGCSYRVSQGSCLAQPWLHWETQEIRIRIKVNAADEVVNEKVARMLFLKMIFQTYINSVLSHPGRFSRIWKSDILPLMNLIVFRQEQRPIECWAGGKRFQKAVHCAAPQQQEWITHGLTTENNIS